MSRELDCAARTAQAALENLFQIIAEERDDVELYFSDRSGLDLTEAVRVNRNRSSIVFSGWASSSSDC